MATLSFMCFLGGACGFNCWGWGVGGLLADVHDWGPNVVPKAVLVVGTSSQKGLLILDLRKHALDLRFHEGFISGPPTL